MKKYSINKLSIYLGYTRDSYYKSLTYKHREELATEMLISSVLELRRHHPRMGGKKLYYLLGDLSKSLHIGRDKFYALLRDSDLLVKKKKSGVRTTNSYHRFHVYKNELSKLTLTRSHQAWCSDITYIRTSQGFKYLFLLTDACSRKIVGWELSESLSLEGGIKALKKAIKQCPNPEGLIHHSDRGIQYCSNEYTNLLHKHKIKISMTEENHCYENAMAERVNGILKDEYLLDAIFKDFAMAKKACSEAIELYNTKRPHWALRLKTPEEVHQGVA
jgi:transposase InsO family protein